MNATLHSTYKGLTIYKTDAGWYYVSTDDGIMTADTLTKMRANITRYKNGESVWGI